MSFLVPEGYMEGLTSRIMQQLPEKQQQPEVTVRVFDRIRPWLYLAAVFAGLLLAFKTFTHLTLPDKMVAKEEEVYEAESEYIEYLENKYAQFIITEDGRFTE